MRQIYICLKIQQSIYLSIPSSLPLSLSPPFLFLYKSLVPNFLFLTREFLINEFHRVISPSKNV